MLSVGLTENDCLRRTNEAWSCFWNYVTQS